MPRAPLLTGKNRSFKWIGFSYSTFPRLSTVAQNCRALLFICVQTSYQLAPLCMAEEVGFEPTGQVKADTTDFKSVRLCPLAHSSI